MVNNRTHPLIVFWELYYRERGVRLFFLVRCSLADPFSPYLEIHQFPSKLIQPIYVIISVVKTTKNRITFISGCFFKVAEVLIIVPL